LVNEREAHVIRQLTNSPTRQLSRILLIRLRQIGDVVFTTPAVRALRQRFPDAQITYIVEPDAAPIVERNPHITDVIVAPKRRSVLQLAADLDLARRLQSRRYDLAIDFHGGPRSSLLTWLSGAPIRIGYQIAGRSWMYTRRVARPRALRARHSVENQWDLIAELGIHPPDAASSPVEMPVDPEAAHAVDDRLRRAGVGHRAPIVVVHVSAGNPFRRWPSESFAALVHALAMRDPARRIVMTSGPSDRDAAGRVVAAARSSLGAQRQEQVVSCGDFSLAELRALLDRASLYIGGDSGPLHVAATSAVPVVGLYGPTLPARSAPWRSPALVSEAVDVGELACRPCDQRVCSPGDFRCLTWIAPEHVVDAAERALGRAAAATG
jgi:predicted lipopolysaccharide heptosyltransferase III